MLTGNGKSFSAGVDLKEPLFADPEIMSPHWIKGEGNYLVQMQMCEFPIIGEPPPLRRESQQESSPPLKCLKCPRLSLPLQGRWRDTARRGAWRSR